MPRFAATAGTERPGPLTVLGLVVLPLVVAGILAASLIDPTAHLDRVTAAIVNEDQPVTVDGQTVPLGRQLAAGLLAAQEPAMPSPSPSDASTPADSPDTGSPSPVDAPTPTDAGATPTPSSAPSPQPVPTPGEPSFTWILTNADEAADGLTAGRYDAVLTIPADFSATGTSAAGLPSEAQQARFSVETAPTSAWLDTALVRSVTAQAARAVGEQITLSYLGGVYAGFNQIDASVADATDGATQLAAGAESLADGSSRLADGLTELDSATATLPEQTAQLADGAGDVAAAVEVAADRVSGAAATFADTAARICQVPGDLCDSAQDELAALRRAAQQVGLLAAGADAVAEGNAALAESMPDLVGGIDDATAGADQVAAGATQVESGATALAQGLVDADGQIPTYSDDDIARLSAVVAQPVVVDLIGDDTPVLAAPLLVMLALWAGGIAIVLALPAVPPRRLLTAATSTAIAVEAVLRPLALGALGGIAVAAVVRGDVASDPGAWAAFAVAAAFVGAVFAVVNQALVAALGPPGRLVAVAIGVVAAAAGVSSTVPPGVAGAASVLPTAPGLTLLVGAVTGPESRVWAGEAQLALIAVAALALVVAGTAARRGEGAAARA